MAEQQLTDAQVDAAVEAWFTVPPSATGDNDEWRARMRRAIAAASPPVAVQEEGDGLIAALKEAAILLSAVAPFMEQRGSSDYTAGAKRINAVLSAMKGDQP